MLLDQEMDRGPILAQTEFSITDKSTTKSLSASLAISGAELLLESIKLYIHGDADIKTQDHDQATYTKIIEKSDGELNFSKSAIELSRQVRAYQPWPGSFTRFTLNDKITNVKLLEVETTKPGKVDVLKGVPYRTAENDLLINTFEDALKINLLQVEGKKPITSKDFINGFMR
jgi:methionyl-tRNA formyltransferase